MYMELLKNNWKLAAAGIAAKVAYDFVVDPYLVAPIRQGYIDETTRVGIEWGSARINYEDHIRETGEVNAYIRMGRFGMNPYFDYEQLMLDITPVEGPGGVEAVESVEGPCPPDGYSDYTKVTPGTVNPAEEWLQSNDRFAEMVRNTTSLMPDSVKNIASAFMPADGANADAYNLAMQMSDIKDQATWVIQNRPDILTYEEFEPSFCDENTFDAPEEEDPLDWNDVPLVDQDYKPYRSYECDYIESMGIKMYNTFLSKEERNLLFGHLFDQDFESGEPESGLHDWERSLSHGQALFVINHRIRCVFAITYRECEDWDEDTSWSVEKVERPDVSGTNEGPLTKAENITAFYKK